MTTIWLAIDKEGKKVKAHRFAETARDTVFQWAKDFLYAGNEGLPEYYKYSDELIAEISADEVRQAEEIPWLGRFMIKEIVIED